MANGSDVRRPQGVDEGFCLGYYRLSYRRKFIRTLWGMLFAPILLFLASLPHRELWFAAAILTGILQAIYNYWKWQTEEKM